jgi:hypothetical protein
MLDAGGLSAGRSKQHATLARRRLGLGVVGVGVGAAGGAGRVRGVVGCVHAVPLLSMNSRKSAGLQVRARLCTPPRGLGLSARATTPLRYLSALSHPMPTLAHSRQPPLASLLLRAARKE